MKRFLLFAGDNYYPAGGMEDFKGDFDTVDEALEKMIIIKLRCDWFHIYNWQERKIIQKVASLLY